MQLTDERKAFDTDGATVLRGVFKGWTDLLAEGIAENAREPGPWFRDYTPDKRSGKFFGDYCNWNRIAPFRKFVEESPAAEVARSLMQSRQTRIFHEHVLVKEAGADKATPWHHDSPYYCVEAEQTISLWIPLDPVPRATCLEFVAGSHRWGKMFRPRKFSGVNYERSIAGLEDMPDIEAHRGDYPRLGHGAGRCDRLQLPRGARRAGQSVGHDGSAGGVVPLARRQRRLCGPRRRNLAALSAARG